MKIRIGTRASQLAQIQAMEIAAILKEGGIDSKLVTISTKGDQCQQLPIDKIGKNGVFVSELEHALISGVVDIAVHSLKDMPSALPEGFVLAPPPSSPHVYDVFVGKKTLKAESDLAHRSIATGSNRRKAQLLYFYPHIKTTPIRGNVETRIQKMTTSPNIDGTILAYAGLQRAGLTQHISNILDPKRFIPSPCQGLLGIELSKERTNLMNIFQEAADSKAAFRLKIERLYQKTLSASCHSPIGIYIEEKNHHHIEIYCCYAPSVEKPLIYRNITTTKTAAEEDIIRLAKELKNYA